MITEKEVQAAIDECLREPVTGNKRSILADLVIIQDYLFGEPIERRSMQEYSYSAPPTEPKAEKTMRTNGGTEFLRAVDGKNAEKVMDIMDELMDAVKTLHPRMYDSFMEKIYSA